MDHIPRNAKHVGPPDHKRIRALRRHYFYDSEGDFGRRGEWYRMELGEWVHWVPPRHPRSKALESAREAVERIVPDQDSGLRF